MIALLWKEKRKIARTNGYIGREGCRRTMRISKRGDSLRRVENVEQQMVVRRMHRGWRKERKKSYKTKKTRAMKDEYKCATAKPSIPSDCFYTSYTSLQYRWKGSLLRFAPKSPGDPRTPWGYPHIPKSRQLIAYISTIKCNSLLAPLISQSIDFNRLHPSRSLDYRDAEDIRSDASSVTGGAR